jgi:LPXTG-motif cell wall-anchored protein
VKITPIAEVQAKEGEGYKFTIEGVVTSNASGYDKDTAFFDCIYLQDETAGINAFPVAGNFKIGDKVRITGTTSSYNGERQIAVTEIELISEGHTVEPTEITAAQLNDGSVLGSLITMKGIVKSFEYANGLIQTIMVEDAEGNMGRVFIDGYITTAKDVENLQVGCEITVTGLASYDNSFDGVAPRIRIRNRADVVCGDVPAAPVDKTALENTINEAKELNGEDYTEESYNALLSALADAEAAYAKGDATQEEVDAAAAALKAAIAALEKIPAETDPTDPTEPEDTDPTEPEETVDKSALEEAIEELFKLNPDDYTEETVQAASKALIEAEAVLANENATQAEVDAAAAALKAAIAALEPKATEPEDTDPTEPEETEPEETTKPSTGDNVQTGDEFNPIIWVVIMLVALAGVVVLFLLRKKMDK